MIIDTSALVAIHRDEPEAKICALAIEGSCTRRLSAANHNQGNMHQLQRLVHWTDMNVMGSPSVGGHRKSCDPKSKPL